MPRTIFAVLFFLLPVWQISSQNTPTPPGQQSATRENKRPAVQRPQPDARLAYTLKAGPGMAEMYDTKIGNTSFGKTTWGFSGNLAFAARLRLAKRSSLELELSAMTMQSKVKNTHQIYYNDFQQMDTLFISDGNIRADWVNLALALKFRYHPKLAVPLFLNVGVNLKRKKLDHSVWTETVTDIGSVVAVQPHKYEYRRYPKPRIREISGKLYALDPDLGFNFSLEYFPFPRWPNQLSIELELNEGIPDLFQEGLGLSQRYVFLNLKWTFQTEYE